MTDNAKVAAGRIVHALNADAKVTVICPTSGLNEEVAYRISTGQIVHKDKNFEPADLDTEAVDMVLCAIDDPEASSRVWRLCKEKRIPANIADVPAECDFYFGSVYRDGPLQVMVSTNGNGPKLANLVKRRVADAIPDNMGVAISNVGTLRKRLREVAPDAEEGPKRMKWYVQMGFVFISLSHASDILIRSYRMSGVCESWELEELVNMTDQDMSSLLTHYASGEIPSFSEIHASIGPH